MKVVNPHDKAAFSNTIVKRMYASLKEIGSVYVQRVEDYFREGRNVAEIAFYLREVLIIELINRFNDVIQDGKFVASTQFDELDVNYDFEPDLIIKKNTDNFAFVKMHIDPGDSIEDSISKMVHSLVGMRGFDFSVLICANYDHRVLDATVRDYFKSCKYNAHLHCMCLMDFKRGLIGFHELVR